ncbi:hypothetical protein B0H15DRAFT_832419, partial [Mycena belliarum]
MSQSVIRLLLGPILLGVSINTFLYGICVTQFLTYYLSKRRLADHWTTRCLVAWEFLIDTFHSAASIYFIWLYMVENFLNAQFLQAAPWPLTAVPLLTAMSACPIQLFLAFRVFSLSKSRPLYGTLMFLTTANAGAAIATSALAFRVATFSDGSRLKPVTDGWLGVSVANDLALTSSLVFYLNRSRTGVSKTDTVINRLIRSAIESAAAATLFAIMVSITFTRLPYTGLHLMFSITLNRRDSLRHDLAGTQDF